MAQARHHRRQHDIYILTTGDTITDTGRQQNIIHTSREHGKHDKQLMADSMVEVAQKADTMAVIMADTGKQCGTQ